MVPDFQLVDKPEAFDEALSVLKDRPEIILDLEADSLHHYKARIGLAQIADGIGSSRATIARLFEQEFGHPVGAEILRQRLTLAKRLLNDGTLSISEIALRVGFCNPAYFTNTFRRATGVTPKKWRTANPSA